MSADDVQLPGVTHLSKEEQVPECSVRRIYVASSWRNIRSAGHEVYDFKKPKLHNDGFHWSEVMPSFRSADDQGVTPEDYLQGIQHERAIEGFDLDFEAMEWADTCVLVLPCGRSAHLELGWFVGQGRRTVILLDGPLVTPELMYRMVDYIAPSFNDLLGYFGLQPELGYKGWERNPLESAKAEA